MYTIVLTERFEGGPAGLTFAGSPAPPFKIFPDDPAHDLHKQFGLEANGRSLPSQLGLCLGELAGASGRVRRGPSLGDSTSAGAENSQATLHVDKSREDDGMSGKGYPAFSLSASESGMTL